MILITKNEFNPLKMNKILIFFLSLILSGFLSELDAQNESVFKPRHIKKVMTRAAVWQLGNPKHELWDWTNGAFYAGISAAYRTTNDPKLLDAMLEMGEKNNWKPGPRLHHADDHVIGQTYVDLFRLKNDARLIQPFTQQMDSFLTIPFQPHGIEVITWWWCDALFMAPPALVKLSVTTGDKKYMEKSDHLYHECYNLLYDKEEKLFARDLNFVIKDEATDRREANGEKIFWSRGNGWVMGGLVLIMSELPDGYPERLFYETIFRQMAERIAELQQEDGLWRSSLLDPDSYPGGEASGSGFYTFALAWGINNGILDTEKYLTVVRKAWIGLNTLLQADGHVGWCQPIGADPRKNFTSESWEVYGTGAFLLAGSEVIKLYQK